MATELLATASTADSSEDLTVDAGTPVTVLLKEVVDGDAHVDIEIKDDAGGYTPIGKLTSQERAISINASGIYRFSRTAGGACGVSYY